MPDGNSHPNVGGLVFPTAFSDGTRLYCSGTLISSTVFLTAAHCDIGSSRVTVTFDSAYQDGDKTFSGTWHADPLYGHDQSDPHDVAVVVFDKAIKGITPAQLPAASSLSNLPKNQQFISVGYGAYEVTNQPGGHRYLYNDVRDVASGTLNRSPLHGSAFQKIHPPAMAADAMAIRAVRIFSAARISSPLRRSPATPSADRPTPSIASIPAQRVRFCSNSLSCRNGARDPTAGPGRKN